MKGLVGMGASESAQPADDVAKPLSTWVPNMLPFRGCVEQFCVCQRFAIFASPPLRYIGLPAVFCVMT